jgi:hypothetical protein
VSCSRALPQRGGPVDDMGRSGGTCALVAVAGRGKEEIFPPFVTRSRGFLLRGQRGAVLRRNNCAGCEGRRMDIAMEALGDLPGLLSKAIKR